MLLIFIYNDSVKKRYSHLVLPAVLSAGSFFGLLLITTLTNPLQNISYAVFFFVILLVLLLSLGRLLLGLNPSKISSKARNKLFIVSVLIVMGIMFQSAGSFTWVDLVVMLLLGGGLLFYSGRREQ